MLSAEERGRCRGYEEIAREIGQLDVHAPKGARIAIDGGPPAGDAPLESALAVKPGSHTVSATRGDESTSVHVDAPAGRVTSVQIDFATPVLPISPVVTVGTSPPAPVERPHTETRSTMWPPPVISLVLAGIGVVSAGVGVGFALNAQSKRTTLDATPPGVCNDPSSAACKSRQDTIDAKQSSTTLSTVFYVAGGAAVLGAVATWVLWPRQNEVSTARVIVSPQPGGLSVSGVF